MNTCDSDQTATFHPESADNRIAHGDPQRLHPHIGWLTGPDGNSRPVALLPDGTTEVVAEEYEVVPAHRLTRWREERDARRAAQRRAQLGSSVESQLRTERVVLEKTPDRRSALEQLARLGVARHLGNGAWALAVAADGYVPAVSGSTLWVTGTTVIAPGARVLLGHEGGHPVVLHRDPVSVEAVVVRDGVWSEPVAGEEFRTWQDRTDEELRRASQPDADARRAALLERLSSEFAVTSADEADQLVLESLRREGVVRVVGRAYVLAEGAA